MSKPDLSEFSNATTSDWAIQAAKSLKGSDPFQHLQWGLETGLPVKPYFDKSTQTGTTVNVNLEEVPFAGTYGRQWHYLETIKPEDPGSSNKEALSALEGAEGILWQLSEMSQMPDPAILFNGIKTEHCQNAFLVRDWNPGVKTFFTRLLSAGNKLPGFLWFDNSNAAECEDLVEFFTETPEFKPLCFDAIPQHEKGLPPSAELSLLLSEFIEKAGTLAEKGHPTANILAKSVFCLGAGRDYFHGIAKIRALKLLISNAASAFDGKDIPPCHVSVFARPSLRNYAVTDPYVNVIRATAETMAAVAGGANFLTVPAFDHFHTIKPGTFSKRIGRNISNLLREESYFDKNADPAAGSYFIESLTEQLAISAWSKMQKAEKMGGFSAAIEKKFWEQDRQEYLTREQLQVNTRQINLVGVSDYNDLELFGEFPVPGKYRETVEKGGFRPIGFQFEVLRLITEDYMRRTGSLRPEVVPLLFGDTAWALARNSFIQGFFPPAGFKVAAPIWWEGSSEAIGKNVRAIVLCSSDEDYTTKGPQLIARLKQEHPHIDLAIAGNPSSKESLQQSGASTFIHLRSDVPEVLSEYQKKFGII